MGARDDSGLVVLEQASRTKLLPLDLALAAAVRPVLGPLADGGPGDTSPPRRSAPTTRGPSYSVGASAKIEPRHDWAEWNRRPRPEVVWARQAVRLPRAGRPLHARRQRRLSLEAIAPGRGKCPSRRPVLGAIPARRPLFPGRALGTRPYDARWGRAARDGPQYVPAPAASERSLQAYSGEPASGSPALRRRRHRLDGNPRNQLAWNAIGSDTLDSVMVEQFTLAACLDEQRAQGIEPYVLFETLQQAYRPEAAAQAGFTHLIGRCKRNPFVAARVADLVRAYDPEAYARCVANAG